MSSLQDRRREWRERLLLLREAIGELFAAESEALSRDLARWGKGFAFACVLLLAAAGIGIWLLALVVAFPVTLLSLWLPVWAATLISIGIVALVVALLALVAWARLRKLGGPIDRVRRRWRDHLTWWNERLLPPLEEEERADEP